MKSVCVIGETNLMCPQILKIGQNSICIQGGIF